MPENPTCFCAPVCRKETSISSLCFNSAFLPYQSANFPNLKLEVVVSHSDWPMAREKSSHGKRKGFQAQLHGSVWWSDSAQPHLKLSSSFSFSFVPPFPSGSSVPAVVVYRAAPWTSSCGLSQSNWKQMVCPAAVSDNNLTSVSRMAKEATQNRWRSTTPRAEGG